MEGEHPVSGSVVYSNSAAITITAQTFQFDITSAAPSTGPGQLTIEANGDYSISVLQEHLNWNLDGILSGSGWNAGNADTNISYSSDDWWWRRSVAIDASTMAALSADGVIQVSITNGPYVDAINHVNSDWVSFKLEYQTN
jgi:hypothetical protein